MRAATLPRQRRTAAGRPKCARAAGVSLHKEPTVLYRFFGADDLLLYVGISKQFEKRRKDHARTAHWWPRVVRHTTEVRSTRSLALRDEARAIRAERPMFNCAEVPEKLLPPGGRAVGRPKWMPNTERERMAIQEVVDAHREVEAALAKLRAKVAAADGCRVPRAHLAQVSGVSRATFYRHLAQNGD